MATRLTSILLGCLLLAMAGEAQAARGYFGYGNYCGTSNNGGKPVSRLDAICAAHDRCLLRVGLPASPFSLLEKSADAARRSCPCDRRLVEEIAAYAGGEGYLAYWASWAVSLYAGRRAALSCRS